ncbi:pro-opiomelanocortin-like [Solea solea]|uniref:pro-opiomelanocortin-like n=1 Tax=Solea solea TaxID=90069 RepID=UPI0027296373|nr:pro-opiomelanocortin-like [Solea solea]
MCPVWLLVAVVVVGGARGAVSQCWEHPSCQEAESESSMMECFQLCRDDLTAEMPVAPGHAHLQPPSLSDSAPQTKRSYSMEHFRWGKPVGRKRRPIKVYTSNGVEEESAEVFPAVMRRRELANQLLAVAKKEEQEEEEEEEVGMEAEQQQQEEEQRLLGGVKEGKEALYKMKHFRWGVPADKRYGGFMKSWDGRSQRPLLTLFKNVINKDGQTQK